MAPGRPAGSLAARPRGPPLDARIAIATCRDWPDLSDDDRPLVAALARRGIQAEVVRWDACAAWQAFDGVLLRTVWDYWLHVPAFLAWLERLDRLGVPCWNSTALVRWNLDKRYLVELEARGVPVVPTRWLARGAGGAEAVAAIEAAGWDDVVVKPAVSAGAWRTTRLARGAVAASASALATAAADAALLVQPFLPEVVADGELSFVFLDGAFSHAVRKRPAAGDYRVQWSHGGSQARAEPDAALLADAERVLAAAPEPGLYARVDGIVRGGHLVLMELEQLEPFLFFDLAPEARARLADAVARRLAP